MKNKEQSVLALLNEYAKIKDIKNKVPPIMLKMDEKDEKEMTALTFIVLKNNRLNGYEFRPHSYHKNSFLI